MSAKFRRITLIFGTRNALDIILMNKKLQVVDDTRLLLPIKGGKFDYF